MFIELTEFLSCPEDHEQQSYLVLAPDETEGRRVVRGSLGCPLCSREYPIADGVAQFGSAEEWGDGPSAAADDAPLPSSDRVHAVLGIAGPGGYVVLVGTAARLAPGLADLMDGVHFVGVNAPPEVRPGATLSLVSHARVIPLKSAMARGVVVGSEHVREPWLAESARLVLRGLRLVALAEVVAVPGVEQLASGDGMWVGERR
jgi:uncharacterized protein YbaR (Trm112 family)